MIYKENILTRSACYKAGGTLAPVGIMVHSTGCNQTNARVFLESWNVPKMPNGNCGVHAFIGRDGPEGPITVFQTLPLTMRSWHCGGSGNDNLLSFEMCEDDLTDPVYFQTVYNSAIELCVEWCRRFNLDPLTAITSHVEGHAVGIASNHGDPMHWFPRFGKSMNMFRADVAKRMTDIRPPAEWARDACAWCNETGLITGFSDGAMHWGETVTREQLAAIMYRLYNTIKKG